MNWTKIPTDLLKQRIPDNEMISIVKYQLLWADLEYQPDDKTALRYITNKQLTMVKQWLSTIEAQVVADIKSSETKRTSRKISYRKNKELEKNVDSTVDSTVSTQCIHSDAVDKIRLDKIRKEKITKEINTSFEEFWLLYPRKISKGEAQKKYEKIIKDNLATDVELLDGVKKYNNQIQSGKIELRFVKHPSTWLNKQCWLDEYENNSTQPYYPPRWSDEYLNSVD